MTLDPKTHKLYLSAADFETPPAEQAAGTPAMVAGSFRCRLQLTTPPKAQRPGAF
jgi:hypothetical protein